MLEKTLESPLDCREIPLVHPKGDQSWVFIGRTDAEAETPILWPSHAKSWLIGKDPDAGRDWRQEEKGTTEAETAGWHHPLNGHGFEWTLEVGDGQGGLACCDSWAHRELDTTEQLNWTDLTNAKRCPVVLPLGQVSQSTYGFLKTNADLLRMVEAKKGGPDEGKLAFCTRSIKAHRGETLRRPEGHKECWREKTDGQSGDFLVITALTVRRGQISTELFSEGSACRQCFIVYPVPGSHLAWVHAFVFRLSPSGTLI